MSTREDRQSMATATATKIVYRPEAHEREATGRMLALTTYRLPHDWRMRIWRRYFPAGT